MTEKSLSHAPVSSAATTPPSPQPSGPGRPLQTPAPQTQGQGSQLQTPTPQPMGLGGHVQGKKTLAQIAAEHAQQGPCSSSTTTTAAAAASTSAAGECREAPVVLDVSLLTLSLPPTPPSALLPPLPPPPLLLPLPLLLLLALLLLVSVGEHQLF